MIKKTLKKLQKNEDLLWQAGTAIIAGSVVLGAFAFFAPKATPVEETPLVEAKPAPNAFADVRIQGHAAIVYDLRTGQTLYSKDSEAQLPLASLTKLLTVYAAADALNDTSPVVMTASALSEEGEGGFTEGETFLFKDIARLALVSSSNDAAEAIAEAAASRKGVAGNALMASAVQAAHLTQTYALNGTGLDEDATVSGGYGSAHDIAVLAGALLTKAPYIAGATTASSITISSTNGVVHTHKNTNQGVVNVSGVRLSKTGYTDLAGGNLVVVFDAGIDHPVAAVVLGSTIDGRFTDVQTLIEATQAHFAGLSPS